MRQKTIDALVDLSITAFNRKEDPSEYARIATIQAVMMTTSEYDPDLGYLATLIAISSLLTETANTTLVTAKIADAASNRRAANIAYDESLEYSIISNKTSYSVINNSYLTMASSACKVIQEFSDAVTPYYETTNAVNSTARSKAKRAALYVCSDTYAVSRAAFVRSCFEVKYISDLQQKNNKFKTIMSERLTKDLSYDTINPGFLLNCMSSKTFLGITFVIGLLGVGAILFAVYHVTALPFIPLVISGSSSLVVGVGLFISGLFAQKRCQDIEAQNESRMEVGIY